MKIIRIFFLLLILSSCNNQKNSTVEKKTEKSVKQSIEIQTESAYEKYMSGKVESFDWNLVFNKAEKYRTVSSKHSEHDKIPNDFLDFSKKFISDSLFQKQHIDFNNLIAVIGSCDETFVLNDENWVFDNWEFVTYLGIDEEVENTFYFSDSVFFCQYILKEIGTYRMLGFEKKDNEWFLTLYDVNDC